MVDEKTEKFIQAHCPDGGFLQSEEWRKFQEATGKKTFNVSGGNFWTNIIEHRLPLVGKYFYLPRGPLGGEKMEEVIKLAEENQAGWIRIEPADEGVLQKIKDGTKRQIIKAPHDMQPREIFVIDVTRPEERLLSEMKSKTRYNINLSQKKGVSVKVISRGQDSQNYFDRFIELVKITAKRNGISSHPEGYYRKMWEILPGEALKLYVAEYENKIIAANLMLYCGKFATYLHGASDNEHRETMAPYLLQWQAIKDAKRAGCEKYDFGGIATGLHGKKEWAGITKFKTGFSPDTVPVRFPGAYDIMISRRKYYLYRSLQFAKNIFSK